MRNEHAADNFLDGGSFDGSVGGGEVDLSHFEERRLRLEILRLEEAIRLLLEENRELLRLLERHRQKRLSSIKIVFGGNMAQGPVILNNGQATVATILYFDQSGNPMPSDFTPPAVSYSINPAGIASSTPRDGQTDDIAFVAAGVATLTASCTSAEGLGLTDTETVTCVSTVPPPPQLASIKIDFSDPTSPEAEKK